MTVGPARPAARGAVPQWRREVSIGEALGYARRCAGLSVTQVSQRTRVGEMIIAGTGVMIIQSAAAISAPGRTFAALLRRSGPIQCQRSAASLALGWRLLAGWRIAEAPSRRFAANVVRGIVNAAVIAGVIIPGGNAR
jgi:hypothetical protein